MLVSPGTASQTQTEPAADEAVLLEALAEAGDALTSALVAHDFAAIGAATRAAEALVTGLDRIDTDLRAAHRDRGRYLALVSRISATARRNAVLLESAWATDAAILRLLAAAAREAAAGPSYATPTASALPAGWLDRTA